MFVLQVLKLIQLIHIFVQVSRWPMAEMIQNNSGERRNPGAIWLTAGSGASSWPRTEMKKP